CEHIASMCAAHERLFTQNGRPARWQWFAHNLRTTAHARKNCRCPVSLMDIAVHRHRRSNVAVALHAPNRHRHIMNHAEAFAMVGKGVMKPSADVEREAVLKRMFRCQN